MLEPLQSEFLAQVAAAGGSASMWAVGEALGLDRAQTEDLAVGLMSQDFLSVINLSGGVAITEAGRGQMAGSASQAAPGLGDWLANMEGAGDLGLSPAAAADLKADLACLRAQLGRSQPLPQVVSACLGAVAQALEAASHPRAGQLAAQARDFLS